MFKLRKKDMSLLMGGILLLSTVGFAILSGTQNQTYDTDYPTNPSNQPGYAGEWQGVPIYEQKLASNQSIFYIQLTPGYNLLLRADPREAQLVGSPSSSDIYSIVYSSKKVYAIFDPEHSGNVSLAFTELSRFLNNRPFEVIYGTTTEYIDESNTTYPNKDPYNTTSDETVIYLKFSNKTNIEMTNRTIIVNGEDTWSMVKAAAKLQLILLRLV
ncbi:MAG: hypothetical protein GOU98_01465 [Candidatus Altiarchaeota archaeon]|nr:hypothetical protein [Candidatus Altiarchaeota archaeon]